MSRMAPDKSDISQQRQRYQCDLCPHLDRPVILVGTSRFSLQALEHYLCQKSPAPITTSSLDDIASFLDVSSDKKRLFFIDCRNLDQAGIMSMLRHNIQGLIDSDVVALFNLDRSKVSTSTLLDIGIRGFFFDDDVPDSIVKGICSLKNNELWVSRSDLLDFFNNRPKIKTPLVRDNHGLSDREKEVIVLLANGCSNKEIADQLFISSHTAKKHVYNITRKLKVKNRMQAVLCAMENLF